MTDRAEHRAWARRALIVTLVASLVVVLVVAVGRLTSVWLLFFAGAVFAAFLRAVATWIARHSRIPMGGALAITAVALLAVIAGVSIWLVPHIAEQLSQLTSDLSTLRDRAQQWIQAHPRLQSMVEGLGGGNGGNSILQRAFGLFSTAVGAIGGLAVIVFVGLYLAASPQTYVHGTSRLFPVHLRERARGLAEELGLMLQRWVIGRLLSCFIVGVGITLGLWALGMPLALSLGVIAGVFSFVPNFGPILSVIPAIAVAVPQGLTQVALVCGVYAIVQTFESYLITPQIQKRAVAVPPVLLLFAQLVMGAVTGVLGVLMATPLVAAVMLIVKRTYVEGVLENAPSPARKQDAEARGAQA